MFNVYPDFFQFDKTDFNCPKWARIVPNEANIQVTSAKDSELARYENSMYANRRTDTFQ